MTTERANAIRTAILSYVVDRSKTEGIHNPKLTVWVHMYWAVQGLGAEAPKVGQ